MRARLLPGDEANVVIGDYRTPAEVLCFRRRWLRSGYLVEANVQRVDIYGDVYTTGPEVFWVRRRDVLEVRS